MKLRLQSILAVALAAASFSSADVIKTKDGTVLIGKVAKINAGTITTKAGVDTPPSPIPAWPVNS